MLDEAKNPQGSVAQFRLAAAQKPHFAPALIDLAGSQRILGHDAEAVSIYKSLLSDPGAARREMADPNRTIYMTGARRALDEEHGDYVGALVVLRDLLSIHSARAQRIYSDQTAFYAVLDHDPSRARTIYSSNPNLPYRDDTLGAAALDDGEASSVDLLRKGLAADIGTDGQEVATLSDAPMLAIAEARFGDLAAARAQVAALPADCYPCLRARGTVASYAGDRRGAEAWFAEAIRQAPGLPLAYVDRGQARFRAGDLRGALSDAKAAVRLGPHDPDGYGLWGDVLARRRRWGAARARYDQALRYAPAWGAARRARDEVAARA